MEGWALIFAIKYHRRNQPGVRSLQNSPLGLVTRSFPLSSTLTLAPPTGWPAFQNNCQIAVEQKKKMRRPYPVSDDASDHFVGLLQESQHWLFVGHPVRLKKAWI